VFWRASAIPQSENISFSAYSTLAKVGIEPIELLLKG
jgi:hypothetical protein